MTMGKGFMIYASFIVGMIFLGLLSHLKWLPEIIPFIAYFVFGFILNRVVLRGLISWHPVYNTLQNVSKAKLSAFLFWPLSYLALFIKLAINKHL
ncbi:hypothetical protein B9T50_07470 [Zymomonas mobilis subsp. mobilis]|nr:hypothetical protein B9T50_07470 [Zymomonas mobilis subsp. mobilis]